MARREGTGDRQRESRNERYLLEMRDAMRELVKISTRSEARAGGKISGAGAIIGRAAKSTAFGQSGIGKAIGAGKAGGFAGASAAVIAGMVNAIKSTLDTGLNRVAQSYRGASPLETQDNVNRKGQYQARLSMNEEFYAKVGGLVGMESLGRAYGAKQNFALRQSVEPGINALDTAGKSAVENFATRSMLTGTVPDQKIIEGFIEYRRKQEEFKQALEKQVNEVRGRMQKQLFPENIFGPGLLGG